MFTTDYLVVFDIETAAANMLLCVKCKSKMFGHINVYRLIRMTHDENSLHVEIVLVKIEGLHVVRSVMAVSSSAWMWHMVSFGNSLTRCEVH